MLTNIKLHCFDKRYLLLMVLLVLSIQKSMAAYTIGPDDLLRISVYGYEDLRTEVRVSADGRITFPLIGEVAVNGKSSIELEEAIAVRLIEGGFVHDAQVNVTVLNHVSQQVSVLGYVNRPGRYPLDSDSSIVDLIAMAEGIDEMGDSKVIVTRTVDGKPQKQELDLKVYLEDVKGIAPFKMRQGDQVYVPKAPMFYIYGEVQRPGGYRVEPDISVVKALPMGGGLTLRGTENGIVIKRKDKSGALQEVDVELGDAVLKDDVIYVGERWF
ncbi:MAG: polysaccharide export protein EpsE [Methylobacter sp.]|nr:polysaccharide export protein EpsE [Methylobacter sp.]